MDEQQNKALIEKTYRDFKKGDLQSYLTAFAENVEWQLPETGDIPYAGIHIGRKQFEQFLSKLLESQEILEYEPQEFILKGNKVIVMGKQDRIKLARSLIDKNRENFSASAMLVSKVRRM